MDQVTMVRIPVARYAPVIHSDRRHGIANSVIKVAGTGQQ